MSEPGGDRTILEAPYSPRERKLLRVMFLHAQLAFVGSFLLAQIARALDWPGLWVGVFAVITGIVLTWALSAMRLGAWWKRPKERQYVFLGSPLLTSEETRQMTEGLRQRMVARR